MFLCFAIKKQLITNFESNFQKLKATYSEKTNLWLTMVYCLHQNLINNISSALPSIIESSSENRKQNT